MSTPLPPHLDPRGRHRGGGHGVRAARPLGRLIGSLISITLLVLAGYYWYTFRAIQNNLRSANIAVGSAPKGHNDIDGKDLNILLVGNDDRTNMTDQEVNALHVGRDGGSLATDTMMIVHIPADGSRATLISLPRDTMVDIPDGYRRNKLNSPYASAYVDARNAGASYDQARLAGANLLVKTITNLTGLTINHYIQIDLLGFFRIANAIDGVDVNLCHAVNDSVARNLAQGTDGGSDFVASKGWHHLRGLQALEFVRQRHNLPNGDLDRVRRQQYFLTAAFRKVASAGLLTKLKAVGDAVTRSLFVDKSLNLIDIAHQLENLTANNIQGVTIPTYFDADGNLQANPAQVQRFVSRLVNPPAPAPAPTTAKPGPAGTSAPAPVTPKATTPPPIDSKCIN